MYVPDAENSPHLLGQAELNDLVRDLELTKEKADLLGSRPQERNLLKPGTKISHFQSRHMKFSSLYSQEENVCFCNDISGLMQEIGCCYDPSEWRLFIDSSKASLMAVLLHNGNEKPSIPVAHATGLNETYESMDLLLRLTKYKDHTWNICGAEGFTGPEIRSVINDSSFPASLNEMELEAWSSFVNIVKSVFGKSYS